MSITAGLIALGVRHLFDDAADGAMDFLKNRLTDHSQALPKALAKANDRAWQAVGLALAGNSLFDRLRDLGRDADMKGIRDQIKGFLDATPTGLENAGASRLRAAEEWGRLRKAGRFTSEVSAEELARRVSSIARHGNPAKLAAATLAAVKEAAETIRAEAPHLAELLTVAPDDGTPLLAAAFAFFFRRELETNDELYKGLSFDYLRQMSERQEHGLDLLDYRTEGILDQIGVLFVALEEGFAAQRTEIGSLRAMLERFVRQFSVPTSTSEPLRVSATNEAERDLLRKIRTRLRVIAPELLAAADWSRLGDSMTAAGMFPEAGETLGRAASAAQAADDRGAEAEAEYKKFRVASETNDKAAAMAAFHRAIELAPERYTSFDLHRYDPSAVIGVGGFGTVFLAEDRYVRAGKNKRVAIKAIHDTSWDDLVERDLAEMFDEADTLSELNHPGIVRTLARGFGDPARRKRPYLVMEYFEGISLEAWIKTRGQLAILPALEIARQVAEAVHAAHQKGVIHRDIKPGNILIAFDEDANRWYVKVIDFGLTLRFSAVQARVSTAVSQRTSRDRRIVGTLEFASPEQMGLIQWKVGPWSDVYSFGKTLQEALFRTTQPTGRNWRTLPEEYRATFQELLECCVERDPAHRRQGFQPILEALSGFNPGERARRVED